MDGTARREREAGNGRTAFIFSSGYIYKEKRIGYIDEICVPVSRESSKIGDNRRKIDNFSVCARDRCSSRAENNKSSDGYLCTNCDAFSKQGNIRI